MRIFRVKFVDNEERIVVDENVSGVFRRFPDKIIKSVIEIRR